MTMRRPRSRSRGRKEAVSKSYLVTEDREESVDEKPLLSPSSDADEVKRKRGRSRGSPKKTVDKSTPPSRNCLQPFAGHHKTTAQTHQTGFTSQSSAVVSSSKQWESFAPSPYKMRSYATPRSSSSTPSTQPLSAATSSGTSSSRWTPPTSGSTGPAPQQRSAVSSRPSAERLTPQQQAPLNASLALLTPPTPVDRTERRQWQYQNEHRLHQGGAVDDEPVGRRGQEANVSKAANTTPVDVPLRSFDGRQQSTPIVARGTQQQPQSTPILGRVQPTQYPVRADVSSSSSEEEGDARNHAQHARLRPAPSQPPLQFSPDGRAVLMSTPSQPEPYVGIEEASTISDDDIAYMKLDLMPGPDDDETTTKQRQQPMVQQEERPPPSSQESRPSRVAAAAAAQAAQVQHERRQRRPSEQEDDRSQPPVLSMPPDSDNAPQYQTPNQTQQNTPQVSLTERLRQVEQKKNVDELNQQAIDYVKQEDWDLATAAFARVLHLHQLQYGVAQPHPVVASSFHNLGTVHAKRAAALDRTVDGDDDNVRWQQQNQYRLAALDCFQAAARGARDSLGPNHPNVAVSLVRVGFLLLQSKQYENAVVTFQEALRIRTAHYGPQHGLVANLHNNVGVAYMHLGRFDTGCASLTKALDIQRQLVDQSADKKGSNRWIHQLELADTLFNLGGLNLEWVRRQGPDARRAMDAEKCFEEALAIRSKVLGPTDPMVLQVQELLDMARALPRPRRSRSVPKRYGEQGSPQDPTLTSPPSSVGNVSSRGRSTTPVSTNRHHNTRSALDPPTAPGMATTPSFSSRKPFDEPVAGLSEDPPPLGQPSNTHSSIFRSGPSTAVPPALGTSRPVGAENRRGTDHLPPPLTEVTVSTDEADDDIGQTSGNGKGTRIFVVPPLEIPDSPARARRRNENDISDETAAASRSLAEATFTPDTSAELLNNGSPGVAKTFSYDAEESCMINDSGFDSDIGRIHFDQQLSTGRDIMVTRPYRSGGKPSSSVAAHGGMSVGSDRVGSETATTFSTGNAERDDVMNRARAILQMHQGELGETKTETASHPSPTKAQPDFEEDGIAPLGGNWPPQRGLSPPLRESVQDPMNHLFEIHNEAIKQLRANNSVDAIRLFQIVLECQQRRHGVYHADVAAALHNVGIAQLRALNYPEALKAFEGAARLRKGALGMDHQHVAVSLTKAGITLLLLHRFEDALYTFREALSIRKKALGALHPSTARIYNNIGCVHVEFNEFREARRAFEAALDIQRNALCQDPDSGPLMFGAATTLCNLGYLYRHRDMHAKAALVLKEAVDLQEIVLGRTHATVLSTLDNVADSCASCGQASDALKYYNMVLERFRVSDRAGGVAGSRKVLRAESVLHYKISCVHRQRNDREAQLDSLKLSLRSIRAYSDSNVPGQVVSEQTETLDRRIQQDIREAREHLEKQELKWV